MLRIDNGATKAQVNVGNGVGRTALWCATRANRKNYPGVDLAGAAVKDHNPPHVIGYTKTVTHYCIPEDAISNSQG